MTIREYIYMLAYPNGDNGALKDKKRREEELFKQCMEITEKILGGERK